MEEEPDNPRAIVETGYDAMADEYLTYIASIVGDPRAKFLAMLDQRLAPGSDVLDLGCGAGIPSTAQLAVRHLLYPPQLPPRTHNCTTF